MIVRLALAAALAADALPAHAALDLSRYRVALERGIDFDEASGVAFNYDRNTLFVIDDEGDDAAEFSLAGTKLTNDKFQQNYRDLEGVTYIGDGRYVLADERTEVMALIKAESQTTAPSGLPRAIYTGTSNARKYAVNGGANVGNNGLEGVAYDPITGGYFGVKQGGVDANGNAVAQKVYRTTIDFGTPTTGTTALAFDPTPLGLGTLSDIAVLAANAAPGADYYGNLLLLSADPATRRLIEVTRTGQLVSSFDLSGLAIQTIEGVVFGRDRRIYLVGETGGVTPDDNSTSGLVVLAAVPEPATWGTMLLGFGLVGAGLRRRRTATV